MVKTKGTAMSCEFDDALDHTGFGKYNIGLLATSCLLILAMYLDIFGFSVVLPAAACDLELSASQQGLLSAVPLIGVMLSSYAWGLCADTLGRRATLCKAMPLGALLNMAVSFAPTYPTLVALKFLSAGFTSSANAAAFVLVGESTPGRHRSRYMFLMASATMTAQFVTCLFALPILRLTFRVSIPFLFLEFRPWRLLMLIISLPGMVGIILMAFFYESPKFLVSKGQHIAAVNVLKCIYTCNTGLKKESYPVTAVYFEESTVPIKNEVTFLNKVWNQTAPLFKYPLLKNSLKLYFILLCAYMTSTGYTMWIPTVTNAYFNGDDRSGETFCAVASTAAAFDNRSSTECDHIVQPRTLYAVMEQSGLGGVLTILLSFIVNVVGKKRTTLLVFFVSAICGVILLFNNIPLLSVGLFYVFLYVSLILGNVNTYLVELNPTYLRGMATSLSVVVARGFGFFSVQLIAALLPEHCTPMVTGYVILVIFGFLVAIFLPPDLKENDTNGIESLKSSDYKMTQL